VELVLWDTGGDYNFTAFRLQCYPDSHLVMICFSIDSPDSLDNAEVLVGIVESLVVFKLTGNFSQFTKELQNAHSSARYMLVGLKKDLRYDWETVRRLRGTDQRPVTPEEVNFLIFSKDLFAN
jgi:Ras homolog gene family, member A